MNAINKHPDYTDSELTPLWRSLTLLRPRPRGTALGDDMDGYAQVRFERTPLEGWCAS